jgi:glycosyltransferase involved in cell wall biosynthesis
MTEVSVLIPNLHSPIVDRTLESLQRQTYRLAGVEVIVVGMDKYGIVHEDELVHHHRTEHPTSPAVARNLGIKAAHGEVLCFVDADCVADPNWLAALTERYADPSVHVVGGAVDFARDNYWSLADNVSMFHDYMVDSPGRRRNQLPTLNLSARRKVFDKVGLFDERYPRPAGEDADLTIRMRKAGFELHFEPRAVVHHYPLRGRPADLLRHSFYQGRYSTKVDPRYAAQEGLPWPLRTRVGLILCMPLLAAGATWRIFVRRRDLRRYWRTAPAVYISKVAWCAGAATHPGWGN